MRLAIEGVSKAFPGVLALDDATLQLHPGEIHALMGENGAGKSTLIKILTGLYRPDSGRLLINGRAQVFNSPRDAIAAGVSAVHQERNLIPRFSIGENILLERPPARAGFVKFGEVHRQARPYLEKLGVNLDTRLEVRKLSVAQMQVVEIAKALSHESDILVLDEPTASITEHEAKALFSLLRQLRSNGVAILFVSHKLEEVFAIADRVTVLRDGRNVAIGQPLVEMSRAKLVSLMVGRDERVATLSVRAVNEGAPALEARGLTTNSGHRDISFKLHRGEILGFYGLVGAGRTELARALVGESEISGGEILIEDRPVRISGMSEALRRYKIGFISEDRKQEGLIVAHSIQRNIGITIWRRLSAFLGMLTEETERQATQPFATKLHVRAPSMEAIVGNLSGGNQQKVSIGKWLAANVEILIVDEPTVGIDINTKSQIHDLIREVANAGLSVFLISSDMSEMVALADRILIMHEFRLIGEIANDHIYESMSHAIMAKIHRTEIPFGPSSRSAVTSSRSTPQQISH
jgi:ribose transport system ATP-binding protein